MNKISTILLTITLLLFTGCDLFASKDVTYTETVEKTITPITVPKINTDFPKSFLELFDHTTIHNIEIQISQEEWDGLLSDMDVNLRTGNYRKATFVYKGNAGDETLLEVGFRTRGNTTRRLPEENGVYQRAHFKIKFDKNFTFDKDSDEYKERDDRKFNKLKALNLKWNRDKDPSQIRELYSYDLLDQAGTYVPKTGSTQLFIKIGNNAPIDYGIYTMIEPVDKSFLKPRFGKDANDGNLYKCLWQDNGPATLKGDISYSIGVKDWENNIRPSYDRKTNEDDTNYSDLIDFANSISNKTGDDFKNYINTHFEVDRFLRYQAMGVLLGMPDDYWAMGNNYYLYFNNESNMIDFIPYDYDHGLGGGWDGNVGYSNIMTADIFIWIKNSFAGYNDLNDRPLMKILTIPEYKERYKSYLTEFSKNDGIFSLKTFSEKYTQQYSLYSPLLDNDMNEGAVMELRDSVKEYFNTRINSVRSQL